MIVERPIQVEDNHSLWNGYHAPFLVGWITKEMYLLLTHRGFWTSFSPNTPCIRPILSCHEQIDQQGGRTGAGRTLLSAAYPERRTLQDCHVKGATWEYPPCYLFIFIPSEIKNGIGHVYERQLPGHKKSNRQIWSPMTPFQLLQQHSRISSHEI